VLRALGRNEEALVSAEHLVEIWSRSPFSWYELAAAHAVLGHNERALQVIEHSLLLANVGGGLQYAQLYGLKGEVLLAERRYEEALVAYENGLRHMSPLERKLWEGKAKALRALKRNEEAMVAEQKVSKLDQRREENLKKKPS